MQLHVPHEKAAHVPLRAHEPAKLRVLTEGTLQMDLLIRGCMHQAPHEVPESSSGLLGGPTSNGVESGLVPKP